MLSLRYHFKRRFGFPNTGAIMGFLPDSILHDMVAVLGEFVGTFLFLFFAYAGCQVANDPSERNGLPVEANTLRIIYIGLSFAVSLAINCWLFYRVSGGQLNPAVSINFLPAP